MSNSRKKTKKVGYFVIIKKISHQSSKFETIEGISRPNLNVNFGNLYHSETGIALASQKVNTRSSKNPLQPSSASRRKWRISQFEWDKTHGSSRNFQKKKCLKRKHLKVVM